MKVEGSYEINAGINQVWDALNDPDVLAKMIPGATALEQVAENSYKASMNIGVGMVEGKFEGTVEVIDPVERESYTLNVTGKSPGASVTGTSDFKLIALSDNRTRIDVVGEAQIGGMLARVSQRLSGNAARSLMNQFFDNLKKNVAAS